MRPLFREVHVQALVIEIASLVRVIVVRCCCWPTQGNGKLSSWLARSVLIDNVENPNNNNMCECAGLIEAFRSSTVDLEGKKE